MKKRTKLVLGLAVMVLSLLPLGCGGVTYIGVGYGGYGGYGPGPWVGPYGGGGTVIVTGRPPIAY